MYNRSEKTPFTSSMEEKSEKAVLLIYKVTSTSRTGDPSTPSNDYYRVHMSKNVEGLSIKRSTTVPKIKISLRREQSRNPTRKKAPLEKKPLRKSSTQQKAETWNGFDQTIPDGSSLTTHDSPVCEYDNHEYWTEILQTSGGLGLLAQASLVHSGSDTLSTTTSNSTSGGMDTTTKKSSLLKNGAQKTSVLGVNSKFGQIGTHSQLKSKEEHLQESDLTRSSFCRTTNSANASRRMPTFCRFSGDSE